MSDPNDTDGKPDTPPAPPAPAPAPAPAPPVQEPPAVTDNTDLREAVKGLTETVNSLVDVVSGLATKNQPDDVSPGSVPWTHWGSRR